MRLLIDSLFVLLIVVEGVAVFVSNDIISANRIKLVQAEETVKAQDCIIQSMKETYQTMNGTYQTMLKNEEMMQSIIDENEKNIQLLESALGNNTIWVTPSPNPHQNNMPNSTGVPETFKDMKNNSQGEVK